MTLNYEKNLQLFMPNQIRFRTTYAAQVAVRILTR